MILKKPVFWMKEEKEHIFEQWTRGQNLHKVEYCFCIEVIPVTDINDYLEKLLNSWDAKQLPALVDICGEKRAVVEVTVYSGKMFCWQEETAKLSVREVARKPWAMALLVGRRGKVTSRQLPRERLRREKPKPKCGCCKRTAEEGRWPSFL